MRLKPITGFTMLVLLFGVATAALQNSAFAQTSANDSDGDYKKKAEKIAKLKHEEKFRQEAKEKLRQEAKEKFSQEKFTKEKFAKEAKEKLRQEAKEQFKQESKENLRYETTRSVCNPDDSDLARKELATIEQRYGEMKMKYYNEWQTLHESGEYDGPWEKFAQEHFLNSPELVEMKNVREKHSQFFRNCNDIRETRPNLGLPNDISEVRPDVVSPTAVQRIDCNQDDYLHAKKELATLEQRYGDYKEKYYQEWQRLHESGEYDGSWENFAKEHLMNSPDMAEARQIHEKYSEFLRHCNQATDTRPHPADPTAPRTVCKEDYEHTRKELAALEDRYRELKMKFYNEWQSLHESGDYDGPWEKFAEEKFLNSPEIADLNHIREKYHQLMMRCSNVQQEVTEQDNYEEETTSDDDITDDLDEETLSNDDLDKLLSEIESEIAVPESIKDEAAWWADNQIQDSDFASSIEYLASQNIMKLSELGSDSSQTIPGWVKAIAAWWAEGKIPDQEFVNAVQFLVDHGIIKV